MSVLEEGLTGGVSTKTGMMTDEGLNDAGCSAELEEFISNCEALSSKPDFKETYVIDLIKLWKEFQNKTQEFKALDALDKHFESLLVCTARVICNLHYSTKVPNDRKIELKQVVMSCGETLSDNQQKICKGISSVVESPWTDSLYVKLVETWKRPKKDQVSDLWELEGWIVLETRIEYLSRVKVKPMEKICTSLHILVEKGHEFFGKHSSPASPSEIRPVPFHPYKFTYNKYIKYLEVYALLCFEKQFDTKIVDIWDESVLHRVISSLQEKSQDQQLPRLFPKLKQWKTVGDVTKWLAKSATWKALLSSSTNSFLRDYFTTWMKWCGSEGMEDSSVPSPLQDIANDIGLISESELSDSGNIYTITTYIRSLEATQPIRQIYVSLFVQALLKDLRHIEVLKNARADEEQQIIQLSRDLSIRYLELAEYLRDIPKTAIKCALAAFSLNPCFEIFCLLFPESECETENLNQYKECETAKAYISDHNELRGCFSLEDCDLRAIAQVTENRGLVSKELEGDIDFILENPLYKGFLGLNSRDKVKELSRNLLSNKSVTVIENKVLDYLDVDYDKCKDLKSQYDPDDDGIEKGFGFVPRKRNVLKTKPISRNIRNKKISNAIRRVRRLPFKDGPVRKGRPPKAVGEGSYASRMIRQKILEDDRQMPNISLNVNPWCASGQSGYYVEFYNLCLRPNDPPYKEKSGGRNLRQETDIIKGVTKTIDWQNMGTGDSYESPPSDTTNSFYHDPCGGILRNVLFHFQRATFNSSNEPSEKDKVITKTRNRPTKIQKRNPPVRAAMIDPKCNKTKKESIRSRQSLEGANPVVQLEQLHPDLVNSKRKRYGARNECIQTVADGNEENEEPSSPDNENEIDIAEVTPNTMEPVITHKITESASTALKPQSPPPRAEPEFAGAFLIMGTYGKGDKPDNTASQRFPASSPVVSSQDKIGAVARNCLSTERPQKKDALVPNGFPSPIDASTTDVLQTNHVTVANIEITSPNARPDVLSKPVTPKTYSGNRRRLVIKSHLPAYTESNGGVDPPIPVIDLDACVSSVNPTDEDVEVKIKVSESDSLQNCIDVTNTVKADQLNSRPVSRSSDQNSIPDDTSTTITPQSLLPSNDATNYPEPNQNGTPSNHIPADPNQLPVSMTAEIENDVKETTVYENKVEIEIAPKLSDGFSISSSHEVASTVESISNTSCSLLESTDNSPTVCEINHNDNISDSDGKSISDANHLAQSNSPQSRENPSGSNVKETVILGEPLQSLILEKTVRNNSDANPPNPLHSPLQLVPSSSLQKIVKNQQHNSEQTEVVNGELIQENEVSDLEIRCLQNQTVTSCDPAVINTHDSVNDISDGKSVIKKNVEMLNTENCLMQSDQLNLSNPNEVFLLSDDQVNTKFTGSDSEFHDDVNTDSVCSNAANANENSLESGQHMNNPQVNNSEPILNSPSDRNKNHEIRSQQDDLCLASVSNGLTSDDPNTVQGSSFELSKPDEECLNTDNEPESDQIPFNTSQNATSDTESTDVSSEEEGTLNQVEEVLPSGNCEDARDEVTPKSTNDGDSGIPSSEELTVPDENPVNAYDTAIHNSETSEECYDSEPDSDIICLDDESESRKPVERTCNSDELSRPLTPVELLEELINRNLNKPTKYRKVLPSTLQEPDIKVAHSVVEHQQKYGKRLTDLLICVVSVNQIKPEDLPEKARHTIMNPMKRSNRLKEKKSRTVGIIEQIKTQESRTHYATNEDSNETSDQSSSDVELVTDTENLGSENAQIRNSSKGPGRQSAKRKPGAPGPACSKAAKIRRCDDELLATKPTAATTTDDEDLTTRNGLDELARNEKMSDFLSGSSTDVDDTDDNDTNANSAVSYINYPEEAVILDDDDEADPLAMSDDQVPDGDDIHLGGENMIPDPAIIQCSPQSSIEGDFGEFENGTNAQVQFGITTSFAIDVIQPVLDISQTNETSELIVSQEFNELNELEGGCGENDCSSDNDDDVEIIDEVYNNFSNVELEKTRSRPLSVSSCRSGRLTTDHTTNCLSSVDENSAFPEPRFNSSKDTTEQFSCSTSQQIVSNVASPTLSSNEQHFPFILPDEISNSEVIENTDESVNIEMEDVQGANEDSLLTHSSNKTHELTESSVNETLCEETDNGNLPEEENSIAEASHSPNESDREIHFIRAEKTSCDRSEPFNEAEEIGGITTESPASEVEEMFADQELEIEPCSESSTDVESSTDSETKDQEESAQMPVDTNKSKLSNVEYMETQEATGNENQRVMEVSGQGEAKHLVFQTSERSSTTSSSPLQANDFSCEIVEGLASSSHMGFHVMDNSNIPESNAEVLQSDIEASTNSAVPITGTETLEVFEEDEPMDACSRNENNDEPIQLDEEITQDNEDEEELQELECENVEDENLCLPSSSDFPDPGNERPAVGDSIQVNFPSSCEKAGTGEQNLDEDGDCEMPILVSVYDDFDDDDDDDDEHEISSPSDDPPKLDKEG